MEVKSIREVLTSNVITVSPDTLASEAISLMTAEESNCILIVQEKKPVGIFTQRDVVKFVQYDIDLNNLKISKLMISPVVTMNDDIDIHEANDILLTNKIRHLAIVDTKGEVVGIVTHTDIAYALEAEYFVELKMISRIMNRNVVFVDKVISAKDAICMMAEKSISCIVVEEQGRPVGILSEGDVTRLVQESIDLEVMAIEDVMSYPICTIGRDATVHEAVMFMKRRDFRRLVVVDNDGKIEGMVTHSDIIRGIETESIRSLKAIIYERDKELHEKSAYLDNILRSATGDAIITIGLDYCITYYNPMAEIIYGYKSLDKMSWGQTLISD